MINEIVQVSDDIKLPLDFILCTCVLGGRMDKLGAICSSVNELLRLGSVPLMSSRREDLCCKHSLLT